MCNEVLAVLLGASLSSVVLAVNEGGAADVDYQFEHQADHVAEFGEKHELNEEEWPPKQKLEQASVPKDCGPEPQFAYGGCLGFADVMGINIGGHHLRHRYRTCMNLIGATSGIGAIDLAEAKRRFELESYDGYKRIIEEQIRVLQAYYDWLDCMGIERTQLSRRLMGECSGDHQRCDMR